MNLNLDELKQTDNLEERVKIIQQKMEKGEDLDRIQEFLFEHICNQTNDSSWTSYCLNLVLIGIQSKKFHQSHLSTESFIKALENTSYFSQRRFLWLFQLPKIEPTDSLATAYLDTMTTRVQGPERSFLRKILQDLVAQSNSQKIASEMDDIDSLERFQSMDRDKKLAWLLKVYRGELRFPGFATAILEMEKDSYILSNLTKHFPGLMRKFLSMDQKSLLQNFACFRNHPDARVKANLIEGIWEAFSQEGCDKATKEFLLDFIKDQDNRVKTSALKVVSSFSRTESMPIITNAIQDCKTMEELKSYRWLAEELNLSREFAQEIEDVEVKLDRAKGMGAFDFFTASTAANSNSSALNAMGSPEEVKTTVPHSSDLANQWEFKWDSKPKEIETPPSKSSSSSKMKILGLGSVVAVIGVAFFLGTGQATMVQGTSENHQFFQPSLDPGEEVTAISEEEQYYLNGVFYLEKQDYQKALENLNRAADLNHIASLLKIAWMYEAGVGVESSFPQCKYWLLKAVELGSKDAEVQLGEVYLKEEEQGVESTAMAYQIFLKYAEKGNPRAQNNLAMMILAGKGTPKNKDLAKKWLEFAAEGQYEPAIRNLEELNRSSNLY